jgi:hypothetical protein
MIVHTLGGKGIDCWSGKSSLSPTGGTAEELAVKIDKGKPNEMVGAFTGSSLDWSIATEGCRDALGAVLARDLGTGLKRGPPFSEIQAEIGVIYEMVNTLTNAAGHWRPAGRSLRTRSGCVAAQY